MSNWHKLKTTVQQQWEETMNRYGSWTRTAGLTWVRRFADVVQIVQFEKMRGMNLRFRVLVIDRSNNAVGGNVTRTTIQGGGVAGPDYYWSVGGMQGVLDSIQDISSTFDRYVEPWLRMLTQQKAVSSIHKSFGYHSSYGYSYSDFEQVPELAVVGSDKGLFAQWMPPSLLEPKIQEAMTQPLQSLGMEVVSPGRCFIRRRGEIYDVFEILQFNYSTQVYCLAYNWVEALASDPSGGFQEGYRVVLTCGAVSEPGDNGQEFGQPIRTFFIGTESARSDAFPKIAEIMTEVVEQNLSTIETYEQFKTAAYARAPRVAEVFEL